MLRRMTSSRKHVRHARLRRQVVGQRDEARQHARHLDARELGAPGVAHAHRQVHAQVRDVRERMARVERQRRQHREDVVLEVLREPGVDRRRVVGRLEEVDALGGQQRPQRLAPARGLLVDLRQRARADGRQLLIGGLAVDRDLLDAGAELLQDGRDAHHEELVEVGAGDGEELDALEQRVRRILRLRQDALVERQPAQLAVDEQRRAAQVVGVEVRPILQRLGWRRHVGFGGAAFAGASAHGGRGSHRSAYLTLKRDLDRDRDPANSERSGSDPGPAITGTIFRIRPRGVADEVDLAVGIDAE